jgi:general secretion pathway protein C
MQLTVKTHFWLVTAVFVAVAAFLCARIAAVGIGGLVWAPHETALQVAETGPSVAAPARLSDFRAVEERNLFNANPAPFPTAAEEGGTAAAPAAPERPEKLPLKLVATGVRDDGKSFAVLEENGEPKIYRKGEKIAPDAVLEEVLKDRIVVSRGKFKDEYELFVERPAGPPGQPPVSRRGQPVPGKQPTAELASGGSETIRQTSDTSYVVDRREVDSAVQNMNQIITQVRIVPNNLPDGRTDGFRVFNIRPASIFARIGLRNGDVLREINGMQLTGFDQAYQAFAKLQTESSIQLNVVRGNQPLTLSYDIR